MPHNPKVRTAATARIAPALTRRARPRVERLTFFLSMAVPRRLITLDYVFEKRHSARKAGQDLRVVRCEQLTHSAARVKGVHQPRPGALL